MKRKIIKQGHNTLTITLPNDWTKKLNLKAGEEIDVVENEDSLMINGHQNSKNHCAVIDITDLTVPMIWRYFGSAYRAGCNEIKVVFDPEKKEYEDAFHYYTTQFEYAELGEKVPPKSAKVMIQEIVNRFVGVDIIESGKGYCIIKELGEVSPKEFENSLRRVFLVILELFDRIIEAIENNEIGKPQLCKEIHALDLTVDKFVDYCARILNRITGMIPERKKPLIFSSLYMLELLGDELKYVAKHLALSKKSMKEGLEIARSVKEHFEMYYRLYYKFDRNLTVNFGKHDIAVYREQFKIKENLKGDVRSMIRHFMMISKFTLSLVELRIQMEF